MEEFIAVSNPDNAILKVNRVQDRALQDDSSLGPLDGPSDRDRMWMRPLLKDPPVRPVLKIPNPT